MDNQRSQDAGSSERLRISALLCLTGATVGALGLMLRAGRHNPSRLLMAGMAVWVLSPFLILASAHAVSSRWRPFGRVPLYWLTVALCLGSLSVYVHDAFRPASKGAFVFVLLPPVSWLLIAIVLGLSAFLHGRQSR
jgi:hypothetical protein